MTDLTLDAAQAIVSATLDHCRAAGFKPMGVVALDARGAVKAAAVEDGNSLKRYEMAYAKAYGSLSLGIGSRSIFKRAKEQPYFIPSATDVVGGALLPVPGGVLILDEAGAVIGALGVSGDTSDNDERAAIAAIATVGFIADPGAD